MLTQLLLVTAVWGASPCELPPGQDQALWAEPLAMAGFTGPACSVRFVDEGAWWIVVAVDPDGVERSARVAPPVSAEDREDAAWLAASLAMPLGARLAALQAAVGNQEDYEEVNPAPPSAVEPVRVQRAPSSRASPPAEEPALTGPEPTLAPMPPEPVVEVAPASQVPSLEPVLEPEPAPPSPVVVTEAPSVREPVPMLDDEPAPEPVPLAVRVAVHGGGTAARSAGPAIALGVEAAVRSRAPIWFALVLEHRPGVNLEQDGGSWRYRAWAPGLRAWWQPRPALELGAGLELAHRRFEGALAGVDAGWSPGVGLGLRVPINLGSGVFVVPALGLRSDLRSTELRVGDGLVGTVKPLWLGLELSIGWSSASGR